GQNVERLKASLDDQVDMAHRQQAVIVAIAAEAPETHGAAQGAEPNMLILAGEVVRAGGGKQRLTKLGAGTRVHGLGRAVMTEEGLGLAAPETFASERLVHQAQQG